MRDASCSAADISVARDLLLKGDNSRAEALTVDVISRRAADQHVAESPETKMCRRVEPDAHGNARRRNAEPSLPLSPSI